MNNTHPYSWLLLVAMWALLLSCRGTRVAHSATHDSTSVVTTDEQHDTVYPVAADSSSIQLVLGHDSAGAIVPVGIVSYTESKRARLPRVRITGNVLSVDCKCDSLGIYAKMYKRYKRESSTASRYEEKPVIVYQTSLWDKAIIALAFMIMLTLTVYIYLQYDKTKKRLNGR